MKILIELCVFSLLYIAQSVFASDVWNMKTFSITHKPGQGLTRGQELAFCDYNATQEGNHSVLISWFTGEIPWPGFSDTIIRYYVDAEITPSIETTIAFLTGSGPVNYTDTKSHLAPPWGTSTVGRLGVGGGAYSTIKIPFSTRIRVTAMMSSDEVACGGDSQTCSFYSLIRGLENYGAITLPYSNLQLPTNARLKSFLNRGTELNATEWTTLASIDIGEGGGCLLMVVQSLISDNAHCLEGTHVANMNQESIMLSSGFEDYYLSGQYFDTGKFVTPLSGLTAENRLIEPSQVTAYRFHEADPVIFQNSFELLWQNGRSSGHSEIRQWTHLY